MLNHRATGSDVTDGYIVLSAEKKIEAEQKMEHAIDRLIQSPAEGNVVSFNASKKARKGGKV